jgi:hypothetical protein
MGGVENYGIISLCLFCCVFVGVVIWALLQKKSHLDTMARAALEPDLPAPVSEQPLTPDRNNLTL